MPVASAYRAPDSPNSAITEVVPSSAVPTAASAPVNSNAVSTGSRPQRSDSQPAGHCNSTAQNTLNAIYQATSETSLPACRAYTGASAAKAPSAMPDASAPVVPAGACRASRRQPMDSVEDGGVGIRLWVSDSGTSDNTISIATTV